VFIPGCAWVFHWRCNRTSNLANVNSRMNVDNGALVNAFPSVSCKAALAMIVLLLGLASYASSPPTPRTFDFGLCSEDVS
jgi:hypothetical protein